MQPTALQRHVENPKNVPLIMQNPSWSGATCLASALTPLHLCRQGCRIADWLLAWLLELCTVQRCWKEATFRRPLMFTALAL